MKTMTRLALTLTLCGTLFGSAAFAETPREERADHPRIVKAIHEMEDAIKYLEAAPHDFGGHRVEAIEATRKAIEQLRLALAFRAKEDTKHGK